MAPEHTRTALAPEIEPGALYAGVYEIGQRLGGGGTGVVYRARHVVLEQERALKILRRRADDDGEGVTRLRLEASVFGRLKSEPTLVMPFDLGFDAATRTHFIAMELLEGADLETWVRERGPLDVKTTIALMRQVARGLDAAHGYVGPDGRPAPIVHRDLSPSNVFLVRPEGPSPSVKLLDFGLAEMLSDSAPRLDRRSGTPLYRACEQAWGLGAVPQTDVWALGLVVYFALSGVPYWLSRGATELEAELTTAPLEPPGQRLRRLFSDVQLPRAFDDWLLRCLRRTPALRFATAGEAVDELELCFGSAAQAPGVRVVPQRSSLDADEPRREPPPWARSRTVSRVDHGPKRGAESLEALVKGYVTDVHPAFKSVVRLADDLMTASGHYLAFAPESQATLERQLEAVAHAAHAFDAASQRLRGPLGVGAFERGLEGTPLAEVSPLFADAVSALLGLSEAHAPPAPHAFEARAPIATYCVHSTLWQTERVRLQARVDVARRALAELERWLVSEPPLCVEHAWSWAEHADARPSAERLTQAYREDLERMSEASERWSQALDAGSQALDRASPRERWLHEAWQLAEPIRRMNDRYVRLEERALELRLLLANAEDAAAARLARDLSELQAFQWYELRPQLNGLLVPVIRLVITEQPEPLQPLIADRAGWQRLAQLLRRRAARA